MNLFFVVYLGHIRRENFKMFSNHVHISFGYILERFPREMAYSFNYLFGQAIATDFAYTRAVALCATYLMMIALLEFRWEQKEIFMGFE